MDHLGYGQAPVVATQLFHTRQVVAMAVGQDDPRRPGPSPLGEILFEERQVRGHARAGIDQDGIAPAHQVRVGAGPRHEAGIQTEHAAHPVPSAWPSWGNPD
jgi:hypothetical protein